MTIFEGVTAFGPHAMRHIVATDYLRRCPGDLFAVAHQLNDSFNTVRRTYYDNDVSMTFTRANSVIDEVWTSRQPTA